MPPVGFLGYPLLPCDYLSYSETLENLYFHSLWKQNQAKLGKCWHYYMRRVRGHKGGGGGLYCIWCQEANYFIVY